MRENFVQESDCLAVDDWQPQHIARYLFHLKRGDEHRKWLLKDMQFQDEYQNAFDHEQVDRFEEQALAFIKKTKRPKRQIWEIRRHLRQQIDGNTAKHDDGTTTTMVSLMKMTTMMISLQNGTRRIVTISRFISIARLSYYSSIIYHISHVQIVF
jgi:hypothetical protein